MVQELSIQALRPFGLGGWSCAKSANACAPPGAPAKLHYARYRAQEFLYTIDDPWYLTIRCLRHGEVR